MSDYRPRHAVVKCRKPGAITALVTAFGLAAASTPAVAMEPEAKMDDTTGSIPVVRLPAAVTAPPVETPRKSRFAALTFKAEAKSKPKPKPKPAAKRRLKGSSYPARHAASSSVVDIAMTYLGVPYLWGGETPAGWDCSGFLQYVFALVGVQLPRTAEEQRAISTPVSDPQPGDFVVYGVPAYHIGLYVGNGQMIDAPHQGELTQLRAVWGSPSYYRP